MFPNYFIPEYIMVSFTNISYNIVKNRSEIQDNILNEIQSYGSMPEKKILETLVKGNLIRLDDEKNC